MAKKKYADLEKELKSALENLRFIEEKLITETIPISHLNDYFHETCKDFFTLIILIQNLNKSFHKKNVPLINLQKDLSTAEKIITNLYESQNLIKFPTYNDTNNTEVLLSKIIDDAIQKVKKQKYELNEGKIYFNINKSSNMDINLPINYETVISNLLLNSVESMAQSIKVEVKIQSKDSRFDIKIKDNGNGIEKVIIDKIFNPFFSTKPKAAGLGLNIAKYIVEKDSGKISVYSDLTTKGKKKTEFTITLPLGIGKSK